MKSILAIALALLCGCECPDIPIADEPTPIDPFHSAHGAWERFPIQPAVAEKPHSMKDDPMSEKHDDRVVLTKKSPGHAEDYEGRKVAIEPSAPVVRLLDSFGKLEIGERFYLEPQPDVATGQ